MSVFKQIIAQFIKPYFRNYAIDKFIKFATLKTELLHQSRKKGELRDETRIDHRNYRTGWIIPN